VFLRKALFQVHLWTGIVIGLYLVAVCVSGSILVFRSELSQKFPPKEVFVSGSGTVMTQEALRAAAERAHPGYVVSDLRYGETPKHAANVYLAQGNFQMLRLFDPYTGEDLGYGLHTGYRFLMWLLRLHDNLLLEETGLTLNAIGGALLAVLAVTGAVIWWPGSRNWRRSLSIDTRANWKRLTWTLHSALGFWFLAFILLWGISGIYLSYSELFVNIAEYFEPSENYELDARVSDRIMYWLAYGHFGRFRNRIPGCGTTCDLTLKSVWAFAGLVPAAMFVTGAMMWWNRVLRPASRRAESLMPQGRMQPAEK
jgi:uncharacterized iron-regulated membrane protein